MGYRVIPRIVAGVALESAHHGSAEDVFRPHARSAQLKLDPGCRIEHGPIRRRQASVVPSRLRSRSARSLLPTACCGRTAATASHRPRRGSVAWAAAARSNRHRRHAAGSRTRHGHRSPAIERSWRANSSRPPDVRLAAMRTCSTAAAGSTVSDGVSVSLLSEPSLAGTVMLASSCAAETQDAFGTYAGPSTNSGGTASWDTLPREPRSLRGGRSTAPGQGGLGVVLPIAARQHGRTTSTPIDIFVRDISEHLRCT